MPDVPALLGLGVGLGGAAVTVSRVPPVWVRCAATNVGHTLVQSVPVVVGGEVGQVRSRVEFFEQIRRDQRREDLSIRELAERHGVHRRTVRQALDSALPRPRKTYPGRARPVIEPWAGVIDGWLVEDDARVITGRPVTVGAAFTAEAAHLGALPTGDFDPARLLEARVDGQPIPQAYGEPSPRPLRRAARRTFPDEANAHPRIF